MTPTDEITRLPEENRRLKEALDAAVKRAEQAERERDALRDCKRPGTLAEPGCGQCVACWRGAYEDANDRAEERRDKAKETDRLRDEVEALRTRSTHAEERVAVMGRALEDLAAGNPAQCLVARLGEGTKECDATDPCPACRAAGQMEELQRGVRLLMNKFDGTAASMQAAREWEAKHGRLVGGG
jgi:hypothetical protein